MRREVVFWIRVCFGFVGHVQGRQTRQSRRGLPIIHFCLVYLSSSNFQLLEHLHLNVQHSPTRSTCQRPTLDHFRPRTQHPSSAEQPPTTFLQTTAVMCQVCLIKDLAAKQRWPKAVENSKPDLNFLVDSIHDEWIQYQESKLKYPTTNTSPPDSLLELCRLLSSQLDALEADREKWWTSPESRAKRQRFELEGDQRKLSELHKINNVTVASFESLSARLGGFVKWSLGMNGGIFELLNAHKVYTGK